MSGRDLFFSEAKEYGDWVYVTRLFGFSGFVALFKTTSNFYVADGLIFKGLMSYSSITANHSAIIQWRKPLKISPLLG